MTGTTLSASRCRGPGRREFLRVGALSAFGLSLPRLRAGQERPPAGHSPGFGRAKACIVLWMSGGPPQHETWDPKPDAPAEVRGPFGWIPTSVPGLRVGELMPRTATLCRELCVVRSLATNNPSHVTGTYELMTGTEHPTGKGNDTPVSTRSDFPYFGSVVKHLRRPLAGVPTTVVLPQKIFNVPEWLGQYAGFLGAERDPWHVLGDPSTPDFRIDDLALQPDLTANRLAERARLLDRLSSGFDRTAGSEAALFGRHAAQAHDLLTAPRVRAAFDLSREPPRVRDRYGRHHFGQGCLLARRLIEAGVSLVQVNWYRERNDDTPMWDAHWRLEENMKAKVPPMDLGYSALLEDLAQRGLLDETLVVWVGEMGRTPKLEYVKPHPAPGRNHWGGVFSMALAGAGVRGGVVYGASDRIGAYPRDKPVGPQNLTATIFHALGLPPETEIRDRGGRPLPISRGRVLAELF